MNASRRARKRGNHIGSGAHSSDDHVLLQVQAEAEAREKGRRTPGPVNCPVCRPGPGVWDRSLDGRSERRQMLKGMNDRGDYTPCPGAGH